MTDNNVEFKRQVARALAKLFQHHPTTYDLGLDDVMNPKGKQGNPDYEERSLIASGTLRWIFSNGYVRGRGTETAGYFLGIMGAQLAPGTWSILNSQHGDAGPGPFGDRLIVAVAHPGERVEEVIADILMRKLVS